MTTLEMAPGTVTSWGGRAHGIGTNVHGEHTHVDAAWDDAAATGLAGFATYSALSSYTTLFTGVVKKVGQTVQGNGANLTSTSSAVGTHDTAGCHGIQAVSTRFARIDIGTVVNV